MKYAITWQISLVAITAVENGSSSTPWSGIAAMAPKPTSSHTLPLKNTVNSEDDKTNNHIDFGSASSVTVQFIKK